MYKYTIRRKNATTNGTATIYGYTYADACKERNLNPEEWVLVCAKYVD